MDNTTIWGHFGQNVGIRPPGVPIYRVTTHCFVINNEEIPSCFILNVYLGYFALSKVPNKAIIWIIPIFGVILVKMWVFDPPGCPYIRLPPLFYHSFRGIAIMLGPECILAVKLHYQKSK